MRKLFPLLVLLFSFAVSAQTVPVDKNWQLLPDPDAKFTLQTALEQANWRPVRVGLSWNAQFEDMRDFGGVGWYITEFTPSQSSASGRILVKFGACDYFCEVYVNGKKVGEHEGGYTPFTFDVTDALQTSSNTLVVRVVDPPQNKQRNQQLFPQFMYDEVPHGKQNWYVQTGGLWQPVSLEVKPVTYVSSVHVTAKLDGSVDVVVALAGKSVAADVPKRVVIRGPNRGEVASKEVPTQQKASELRFDLQVNAPRLWSPEHPELYSVEATVGESTANTTFGFRELTARNRKLYLNGQPFYIIAALDQDFYPETIYTPPSKEYLLDEMRKAKQLGLNTLRCHIKACTPEYLDAADEAGVLVWYEIPSWNDEHHWTRKAADRGMQLFREALERDWNHPSLVIQSVINESWGADLKQANQRAWLRSAYDDAKKAVAPLGRLVVDNSACCENFHVKSDLDDFHQYFSIPDHAPQWTNWVRDFASRPKWSFSPHGDAVRTGQEPLIVSEFGNWGLPKLPDHLPWWFSRDFNGREITLPAGVQDRFRQFKFDRIFHDYTALAEATQWHQFESLKFEIEQMRMHPSIQGYVITEFTDVNWESNGLMDIWRNPKAYARELRGIQQPDTVALDLPKRNYSAGERVELGPVVSHYSSADLKGAVVEWRTSWGKDSKLPITGAAASGTVLKLQSIAVPLPSISAISQARIDLRLLDASNRELARNRYVLNLFPRQERKALNLGTAGLNPELNTALRRGGYQAAAPTDKAAPLIATKWSTEVARHLDGGGTALLLLDSADALPANFAVQLKTRERNNYNGDWVSNFNWVLSSSPVFSGIAFNNPTGWEAQPVTPDYVVLGVQPENFDDVLAGVFYGWINANSALMLQARYGSGKVLLTTFRFDQYGKDPYATELLDNMIRYAVGGQFAPKFSLR